MTKTIFLSVSIAVGSLLSILSSGCVDQDAELGSLEQHATTPSPAPADAAAPSPSPTPAPIDAPAPTPSPSPSASPSPSKVTTDNVPKTWRDTAAEAFTTPPTKPKQFEDHDALDATAIPKTPPVAMRTSAMGGTCVTVPSIPDGYLVGSSGAEGCIIAVIVKCDGTAIACHFSAGDNPVATLAKLAPFGACAHAAIAGGTNERESNLTLMQVFAGLDGVTIDGILDRIGVFWDAANGRWVYGPLDVASQNK